MKHAILVTGGCGFIGSNFIRHVHRTHPELSIINLDKLSYAGNPANLRDLKDSPRYCLVHGDILDENLVRSVLEENSIRAVVHFAAESHVDRSIAEAGSFVQTNVVGTHILLETTRHYWEKRLSGDAAFRFVHVSTDEIYGTLGQEGLFSEESPFRPNSPYAATKAAGDLLVRAYFETYAFPALVVRPSNNYGPYQFPEKFIPLMITNLIEEDTIPIYGRGLNVRDWIFVEDACRAVESVLAKGVPGEAYNAGGESQKRNIDVAMEVLAIFGKNEAHLAFVPDRPGHDLRYALSNEKIRATIGWQPTTNFEQGLEATIAWYMTHEGWWKPLKQKLSKERKGFWSGS